MHTLTRCRKWSVVYFTSLNICVPGRQLLQILRNVKNNTAHKYSFSNNFLPQLKKNMALLIYSCISYILIASHLNPAALLRLSIPSFCGTFPQISLQFKTCTHGSQITFTLKRHNPIRNSHPNELCSIAPLACYVILPFAKEEFDILHGDTNKANSSITMNCTL